MPELEIGPRRYRTGKLDAFKQFHITRKLLPLFSGMGSTFSDLPAGLTEGGYWKALGPVSQAIADMTTEDSEWVLKTCLSACSTFNGRNWVPITTPQGDLMYEDIEFPAMLQLCMTVLQDNLGSFFPGVPPNGSAGEAQVSPLPMPQ